MPEDNKDNLLFFEAPSMSGLHALLSIWQKENRKRFLSVSVQQDNGMFCCIALTNPTEVVICSGSGGSEAKVSNGNLDVYNRGLGG